MSDERPNFRKTRNQGLNLVLQAAMKSSTGLGLILPACIKSRFGHHNQGTLKVSTAEVIDAVVKEPSHQVTPVENQSGFVSVIEPFVFTEDVDHVSVAMGAGGVIVAQIPTQFRAQLNFVRLCLETILGLIDTRHEALVRSSTTVFFGPGVGVEVRRRSIAVRAQQLVFTAITPAEVARVSASLHQLLLNVKSRASQCGDQHADS